MGMISKNLKGWLFDPKKNEHSKLLNICENCVVKWNMCVTQILAHAWRYTLTHHEKKRKKFHQYVFLITDFFFLYPFLWWIERENDELLKQIMSFDLTIIPRLERNVYFSLSSRLKKEHWRTGYDCGFLCNSKLIRNLQ